MCITKWWQIGWILSFKFNLLSNFTLFLFMFDDKHNVGGRARYSAIFHINKICFDDVKAEVFKTQAKLEMRSKIYNYHLAVNIFEKKAWT